MSGARVRVTGLAVEGRHGANLGERDAAQRFVVDLDVEVAAAGDALEQTADYEALSAAARRVVEERSFVLLETLAAAIAEAVAAVPGVVRVRATAHKPAAAAIVGAVDVSAEADRGG